MKLFTLGQSGDISYQLEDSDDDDSEEQTNSIFDS